MLPEIAIGAIVAAIIGAMISLAGLIVAKESKVSEFRQAWIDSLRGELSSFASNLNALSDANVIEFDDEKERFETLKDHTSALNEAYYSVALRLNVDEAASVSVRSAMVNLAGAVHNPASFVKENFDKDQVEFIRVSNALLKDEWKRVKAGEKVYRDTRRVAVATILSLAVIMIVIIGANLVSRKTPATPPANAALPDNTKLITAKAKRDAELTAAKVAAAKAAKTKALTQEAARAKAAPSPADQPVFLNHHQ
jgi:hypothetical protein